jgi:hypothetical protein
MCVWAKGSRERCAKVTSGEGRIIGKGAEMVTGKSDVGEPSLECDISVPFAGYGLEIVCVSGDLALVDIQVNAGPCAKLVN